MFWSTIGWGFLYHRMKTTFEAFHRFMHIMWWLSSVNTIHLYWFYYAILWLLLLHYSWLCCYYQIRVIHILYRWCILTKIRLLVSLWGWHRLNTIVVILLSTILIILITSRYLYFLQHIIFLGANFLKWSGNLICWWWFRCRSFPHIFTLCTYNQIIFLLHLEYIKL